MRPDLPEGLDAVIAKALDKRPDRRFATCGDLMSRRPRGASTPPGRSATPRRRAAATATATPRRRSRRGGARRRGAARRPRVLLAGVDADTRAVARVALGEPGRRARGAGAEARSTRPRGRPGPGDLDWARRRRRSSARCARTPLTRDAKVLLLVDDARSRDRDVAAAGADERLATPFSPLQLQVKLRKLLGAEAVGG